MPQWTEGLWGRKHELFFALLRVDGDKEQLMDREVSGLKLGLACREQKVLTTHELLQKEQDVFGGSGKLQ